ncbi:MAG: ATP phosphoribosyltransferase regulatory subunit [Spirochaetia bacterium]|nr:ATP phosphoribosyltransferase regulatory subunit [Spirochaetia bacterium]
MHSEFRKTRSPYGFPFLDPRATENLYAMIEKIKKLLIDENYRGVIPGTLDFPETFQEYETFDAFHSRDSHGEDLYLRSDATAQIIKGFANFLEHSHEKINEYKYFYVLPVFRDARKSYPRLREIYQVGAENIGMDSDMAMPELVYLADKMMKQTIGKETRFIIGDVRVLHYISEYSSSIKIKDMILNRDVPSLSKEFGELGWDLSMVNQMWSVMLYAPELLEWKERWNFIKSKLNNKLHQAFMNEIERLSAPVQKIHADIEKKGVNISWEPLLVRNVEYYTGFIFEGYVEGLSVAPLRGGSYDNLVGKYSRRDMTACGFALDMSSLILL